MKAVERYLVEKRERRDFRDWEICCSCGGDWYCCVYCIVLYWGLLELRLLYISFPLILRGGTVSLPPLRFSFNLVLCSYFIFVRKRLF